MVGPRIFTVGNAIYGAGFTALHQDIVDLEEAKSALIRIKAEGGPASISYKNYNLPSRSALKLEAVLRLCYATALVVACPHGAVLSWPPQRPCGCSRGARNEGRRMACVILLGFCIQ